VNESQDREALLELVAAYALGVLPARDHALVTAFILADPEARREFEDLRGAANLIGLVAEEPVDTRRSLRMKERLMATVRGSADSPRMRPVSARRGPVWAASLAAVAAFVFGLISVIQNLGLRSDLADLQRRTAALQAQSAGERRTLARDETMLADLSAANAKRYPVAYGTVVTRGSHLYLALSQLPELPRGHVYQAWTLARGAKTMTPRNTFTPSPSGVTLVPLPDDATRVAAVALSVEPDGGSRAPTTKPTFVQPLT
jgi:anti-sigma-K factor RskA